MRGADAGERPSPIDDVLVLWDVDHTLVDTGGLTKEVFQFAFMLLTGRTATEPVVTEGRTDPVIMTDLLRRHGLPPVNADQLQEALSTALGSRLGELRQRGRPMPGAAAALVALHQRPGLVQSVLTGNIRRNAVTKLSTFGLADHLDFEVGAYGSDNSTRAKLVGVAQERAVARYGVSFGPANTILIGDTPRDVQAGLDGGAKVVAVATGDSSAEELRLAGAHAVLPSLADTPALTKALRDVRGRGQG
jgi:phosphoglycolate phosphatase-like HAD superfamily hydrolase